MSCNISISYQQIELHLLYYQRKDFGKLVLEQYSFILLRVFLESDDGFYSCPNAGCKLGAFVSCWNRSEAREATCVSCQFVFCLKCSRDWTLHADADCQSVEEKGRNESDVLSENYKKKMCHACPSCSSPIEKNGGCPHMTCRKCDYEFCWICNGSYFKGHMGKEHSGITLDVQDFQTFPMRPRQNFLQAMAIHVAILDFAIVQHPVADQVAGTRLNPTPFVDIGPVSREVNVDVELVTAGAHKEIRNGLVKKSIPTKLGQNILSYNNMKLNKISAIKENLDNKKDNSFQLRFRHVNGREDYSTPFTIHSTAKNVPNRGSKKRPLEA